MALLVASQFSVEATAHPGGTDRYGCHVESATGARHCHNDGAGEGDGASSFVLSGEAGLEVGRILYSGQGVWMGWQGGGYIQHEGSVLAIIGVTFHYQSFNAHVVTFIDLGIGAAFLDHANAFAFRMSAGLKFGLVGGHSDPRGLHLKLGALIEAIADGVSAEPIGVSLVLGVAL